MVKKVQNPAARTHASPDAAPDSSFDALGPLSLPVGVVDSSLAQSVKDSAQQIWAAGLASFAKAQGEGQKAFDALVHEGLKLQKKTQASAGAKLNAVASMAEDVSSRAGQQWGKIEAIFEARVSKALNRLDVPSAQDLQQLVERLDRLTALVNKADAAAPASAKPAPRRSKKALA